MIRLAAPLRLGLRRVGPALLLAAVALCAAGGAASGAGKAAPAVTCGEWYFIGPFQAPDIGDGFAARFAPEEGVNIARSCDGRLWQKQPKWQDGLVHTFAAPARASVYLYRTLTAVGAGTVKGYFGSDDGLEVWVNGRKVASANVLRGPEPNQNVVDLPLKAGVNELLVKVYNAQGSCGFYFSLSPRPAPGPSVANNAASSARGRRAGRPRDNSPIPGLNEFDSLRAAVEDLGATFGPRYPRAAEYLARLEKIKAAGDRAGLEALRTEAMLANPLLDFDKLLVVRRRGNLGMPANWLGNCALSRKGFDNEIAVLSPVRGDGKLTTVYRPAERVFVGDVDLHWDADRLLFSSVGDHGRWGVFELRIDPASGRALGQPREAIQPETGIDHYDACYLPDGRLVFCSTGCFQGVPCIGGGSPVANLYIANADGGGIRRLCFDQDHNWCPTVANDGRVLYTRWEYSDTPHYFTRILMGMNPDGTQQMAVYGSNSYWPNSLFYVRPVPDHPTKVVGIVSGHHGVARVGEMVIFDPARSGTEADGAVQRIPGFGRKVDAPIVDGLVNGSRPKFLHPFPLSEKYFLVSCDLEGAWAVYLVDVFDNFVKLCEVDGEAVLEPLPLRRTPRARIIPDKVDLKRHDATVYLANVYAGQGLKGVPRGTVKHLRIFAFDYGYQGLANHTYIGIDGPWDVHRIVGTVPVEPDGSAVFRVPAYTPISLQPLDGQGRALQVMRSWYTAMPGESVTCVGCHERTSDAAPVRAPLAMLRPPSDIAPWHGPARGFSFKREVQPVLDKYCVRCHDGSTPPSASLTTGGSTPAAPAARADGAALVELRGKKKAARAALRPQKTGGIPDFTPGKIGNFTRGYTNLHRYVYRPGPESDYHLSEPCEFHADASELIQMLTKGHHGVQLSREAWDRLYTWIDLNVPDHGTWSEFRAIPGNQRQLRCEMYKKHCNMDADYEAIPELPKPLANDPEPAGTEAPRGKPAAEAAPPVVPDWPFDGAEAKRKQKALGQFTKTVDLGDGAKLELVCVPGGEFVMGDPQGAPDEKPACRVKINKPFWMGACEVTNAQFARFQPDHDSRYFNRMGKDQNTRGMPMNAPTQPVLRVTWLQAMAFCRWLGDKAAPAGLRFTLPTEAQWEWACRAGSGGAMNYGSLDADFGGFANLADQNIGRLMGSKGAPGWRPAILGVNDRHLVTAPVGSYQPNAWGLHDMHGNAAEWTRSEYRPYPYREPQAEEGPAALRVVRGGSFHDRPCRARSGFRWRYAPWQPAFNVGFRVAGEAK